MISNANVVSLFKSKANCNSCGRISQCFGRHLKDNELSLLNNLDIGSRLLHRGDRLFHSGSKFEAFYVIKAGDIKTTLVSQNGEEQIIGFYASGDFVGLDAMATEQHACNAIALDTCSVCVIKLDQVLQNINQSPALLMTLLKFMSESLLRDENMLLNLGKKDAEQRLASFLLAQARTQKQRGFSGRVFNLAMSRSDIGNHLNLAVETVSRLLTRFKAQGLINVDRNEIKLLDEVRLDALSGNMEYHQPANIAKHIH